MRMFPAHNCEEASDECGYGGGDDYAIWYFLDHALGFGLLLAAFTGDRADFGIVYHRVVSLRVV